MPATATASNVDKFAVHLLADALAEGSAMYWRHRAQTFLDARPRPGDFTGRSTVEDRRRRWRELTGKANACLARAEVALRFEQDRHDAEAALIWAEAS